MKETYDVYCDFDMQKHKAKYVDYLEVLIKEDGEIVYAVPSHQMKAEQLCREKLGITHQQLVDMCPEEYHYDYMNWLLSQCRAISVWNTLFMGTPNDIQLAALKRLKLNGLYYGSLQPTR